MLENEIINYYDSIKPSPELIERTISMSNEHSDKRIKISKKAIALIVAAVILALGITGYAGINRIIGDNKGIVSESTEDNGLIFNFSNASRTPDNYSDKDEAMVKELEAMGHTNVLLPTALFDYEFEIYNVINPFLTEHGSSIQMRNKKYDVTLNVMSELSADDMDGFIGTGDSRTICNVVNVNGIDVCICIEGDDEIGYCPYIFYSVDDTLYWINFYAGENHDKAVSMANDFVATIKQ